MRPRQLGTRWVETREVFGRLDDAQMEITSFEHNRTYTVPHHEGGVRIDTVFTLDPVPAGTKVSIEFELNSQGLAPGLLSPLEWAANPAYEEVPQMSSPSAAAVATPQTVSVSHSVQVAGIAVIPSSLACDRRAFSALVGYSDRESAPVVGRSRDTKRISQHRH